ncbi:MAG: proton-conducting transporter membrane subunit, partial [Halieaceae bacterium]|nr:proton-conducting transporter membrane subunit [Halieaceae bacterium]
HGWLIQVVESPTPVSALLHAGVINLGGFLLLLFAPLFSQATVAQWFVLVVAGLTTAISALVMSTRISIKVRLAWSTTAQMGLMLVECALGLYELALLHLCAHSCYKAYAFLNAGTAVDQNLVMQLSPPALPPLRAWVVSALIVLPLALLTPALLGLASPVSPWLLIGLALLVVCAERFGASQKTSLIRGLLVAVAMLAAYVGWKLLAARLLPEIAVSYHPGMDIWASLLFIAMLGAWMLLRYRPAAAFSRKLFIALNAGFYLDEWATRTTLALWPVRVPRTLEKKVINQQNVTSQKEAVA